MKRCLISLLLLPLASIAQLQLPEIFSDNMVLQRGEPIHIWGKATPGKHVQVMSAKETKSTTVRKDSSWSIYLGKQKADTKPQVIFISCGKERITLNNIVIGDVWLCSGQSNMEWPMSREMHWRDERKTADQPLIRFNNPPPAGRYVYGEPYTDSLNKRLNTGDFYEWSSWQNCDSNTVKDMSAVGYFFAKAIVEKEGVPIGLINLSIGGAPIETFISREAMQHDKHFAVKVQGNWLENKYLPEWIRERARQNVGGNDNGYKDDIGLNHAYKPGFAYESGVKPLLSIPIKGILWYQGESNALEKERMGEYKDLMRLLINDYRRRWKNRNLPFYWVQLSSIDTLNYNSKYWPEFRDEQRKLLSEVENGGMAVSSDIGFKNDVHPTDKKTVGERLARWALQQVYGKKNIVPSGPLPVKAKYEDGKVVVQFRYAKGLKAAEGERLRGLSLDGKTETAATIHNGKVVIWAAQQPDFIYYGWKPFTDANLVNAEGLPASTFKLIVK
jgi:sialate O-acetylesterase